MRRESEVARSVPTFARCAALPINVRDLYRFTLPMADPCNHFTSYPATFHIPPVRTVEPIDAGFPLRNPAIHPFVRTNFSFPAETQRFQQCDRVTRSGDDHVSPEKRESITAARLLRSESLDERSEARSSLQSNGSASRHEYHRNGIAHNLISHAKHTVHAVHAAVGRTMAIERCAYDLSAHHRTSEDRGRRGTRSSERKHEERDQSTTLVKRERERERERSGRWSRIEYATERVAEQDGKGGKEKGRYRERTSGTEFSTHGDA